MDQWWRDIRGRAPNDPIEPWEELRDDIEIPARIREDHARRRTQWLAEQTKIELATSKLSSMPAAKPNKGASKIAAAPPKGSSVKRRPNPTKRTTANK